MNRSALLITALFAGSASGQIVLDTFDSIPGDDAGGPRTIASQVVTSEFGVGGVDAFVDTGAGAFFYASDPGVRGIASIIWDNQGGELNLDAAALQIDGFELDFATVDQDFTLELALTSNGINEQGFAVVEVGAGLDPQTVSIALGDFTLSNGFDLTDVDEVRLFIGNATNTVDSLDFVLTEFRATVVPAPASLAMIGVAGLAARRRR